MPLPSGTAGGRGWAIFCGCDQDPAVPKFVPCFNVSLTPNEYRNDQHQIFKVERISSSVEVLTAASDLVSERVSRD